KTEEALRQEKEARQRERQTSYFQTIALAERQVADKNVSRAEELLEACPEPLRGGEWHYLTRRRYQHPVILLAHRHWPLCVAFRPDGRILASGLFRPGLGGIPIGEIKIWDRVTGKEIRTPSGLSGHLGPVSGVAFSPDGKRLASAGWDSLAKVWDLSTGEV